MTTENRPPEDDEFLTDKRAAWSDFLRLTTYSIVGASLVLIGMAVFLLN
ncbi:MAG: hypothetical protein V3R98_02560 [Alphaproteobacteria bacterium]